MPKLVEKQRTEGNPKVKIEPIYYAPNAGSESMDNIKTGE